MGHIPEMTEGRQMEHVRRNTPAPFTSSKLVHWQSPHETSTTGEERACQRDWRDSRGSGELEWALPNLPAVLKGPSHSKSELVKIEPAQRNTAAPSAFKSGLPSATKWKERQERQASCQNLSVPEEGVQLDKSCLLKDNAIVTCEHKKSLVL